MSAMIEQMLKKYEIQNIQDQKNAIKEIIQEIVLCGLSRAGFFKKAAFYGGTALRIFHGLDRFSEDLDFSLETKDDSFNLADYLPVLEKEVRAFGLNVEIQKKKKTKESDIQSAFLKGNTKELLLLFYADGKAIHSIPGNEVIKVKFEIDVNPPEYATFEHQYRLLPAPYEVRLYDMPSLFAGKIGAVLCRAWRTRIKGRDLYDYVFYLSKNTPVNQKYLRASLLKSGYIDAENACSLEEIKKMLKEKFENINYAQAKSDVEPFIRNPELLDIWSADFFKQITDGLTSV